MTTVTEERTLAQQHADSVAETLWERYDEGAVFGYADRDHDCIYSSREEAEQQGVEPDEIEEAYASDYLSDVLDIRYIVDSDRSYRNAQICLSLGGPNVWIYTEEKQLHVWWGFEHAVKPIPTEMCEEIDQYLDEIWEMGA